MNKCGQCGESLAPDHVCSNYDIAERYNRHIYKQAAIENAYNRYKNYMPITEAMLQAIKDYE